MGGGLQEQERPWGRVELYSCLQGLGMGSHAEGKEQRGSVGWTHTHTHTPDTGDGERKGMVSQTCSSIHRAQRAPEGPGSLARCPRDPRCV